MEQQELARRLEVSAATVANWEHGRNRPRGSMLRDLARALGKPLSYFTGDPASDAGPQPTLDMDALQDSLQRIVARAPDAPRGADYPGVQELLGNPELCQELGVTEADKRLLAEHYMARVGPGTPSEAFTLLEALRKLSVHR
jgi:transcriptional regulator with XRE-family HTH domain